MLWLHCGPQKTVSDPPLVVKPESSVSEVMTSVGPARVCLHTADHTDKKTQSGQHMSTICVCVCLSYRQPMTGQLLKRHMKRISQAFVVETLNMFLTFPQHTGWVQPSSRPATKSCHWEHQRSRRERRASADVPIVSKDLLCLSVSSILLRFNWGRKKRKAEQNMLKQ